MQAFPMISIGGLPTFEELRALKLQRFDCLVSLSGSPFELIYGEDLTAQFELKEYEIPDLFSRDDVEEAQWQAFRAQYLDQLIDAVRSVANFVTTGRFVHCFCHQGISRSSLVVAGALVTGFGLNVADAVTVVEEKNPNARFFSRSYAILKQLEHQSMNGSLNV